jgi:CBS domain-containing protein
MLIKEIMKKDPDLVTCRPSESVMEAAKKMDKFGVGCVLVTQDGSLRGILTDRDITLAVVARGRSVEKTRVEEVMTSNVTTATPDLDLMEAVRIMGEEKIERLPVRQANGALVGFVSLADVAPIVRQEVDSFLSNVATAITH